jgi:glycosyltransferase involved in cell wall biosynthesis
MTNVGSEELVSFIVFGFNQEAIIHASIDAAFAQTYPNLEIVLSDNCSEDGTFDVMRRKAEEYDGPHKIRLNRNDRNLGFIGHVNKAFDLCSGAMIVYNPGDDISVPERTAELYEAYHRDRPLLVHSDAVEMDADGTVTGREATRQAYLASITTEEAALSLALGIGATCAWNPELIRLFGPISEEETFDDLVFCFRAILADRIAHVPKPLVYYRTGIGLSQHRADTARGRIKQEHRNAARAVATYRQRLADCRRFAPERMDVIRCLEQQLEKSSFKLRVHENWRKALFESLGSASKMGLGLSVANRVLKAARRR